jgi:nifR3 family TIM-barrel protein
MTVAALNLDSALFLAPVAGYTGRAFRSICAEFGSALGFTELVSAEAIVRGAPGHGEALPDRAFDGAPVIPEKTANLLRRGAAEKNYAIQLFGANPETLYRAAALLAPFRPDIIDLTAGCPVPKVTKTGAGSALMRDPVRLGAAVAALVRAAGDFLGGIPVTVKLRSGWDAAQINYRDCAAAACDAGAAMITLHPRTRAQGYAGTSDWEHLADLADRCPVPVAGSGDLFSPEDAVRMLRVTGCAAVMFARGAIGNPFIFRETRSLLETGSWTPASGAERIATAFRELSSMTRDLGEKSACLEMRKIFCAYTKGLPDGAKLRNALVHAASIEEYRAVFSLAALLKPQ